MKRILIIAYLLTLAVAIPPIPAFSQTPALAYSPSAPGLTIAYTITLRLRKGNAGIGELYNGGIQTFFSVRQDARLRLASLMRIESVFAHFDNGRLQNVTLVKESGHEKQKSSFSSNEWNLYNSKYKDAARRFTEDTTLILGHICKKVVITLKDGRQITAWYYPTTPKPSFSCLLPAFSEIPGIVLKYEYTQKKKTIIYTAASISYETISPDVFLPPGQ